MACVLYMMLLFFLALLLIMQHLATNNYLIKLLRLSMNYSSSGTSPGYWVQGCKLLISKRSIPLAYLFFIFPQLQGLLLIPCLVLGGLYFYSKLT